MSEPAWKAANSAHCDELLAVHLSPRGYDLTSLRERRRRLNAIEETELWPVDGQYILHLQCHFGADTLTLAQRGARVVGLARLSQLEQVDSQVWDWEGGKGESVQ